MKQAKSNKSERGAEHVPQALPSLTIHSAPLAGAAFSTCRGVTRAPRSPPPPWPAYLAGAGRGWHACRAPIAAPSKGAGFWAAGAGTKEATSVNKDGRLKS